jgi:hypothetical protein
MLMPLWATTVVQVFLLQQSRTVSDPNLSKQARLSVCSCQSTEMPHKQDNGSLPRVDVFFCPSLTKAARHVTHAIATEPISKVSGRVLLSSQACTAA